MKTDPPSKVSEQDIRSHLDKAEDQRLIHELQVHKVELELQNHALLEIRNQLEQSLQDYTELYDFAPVGYFTLNADGKIRKVNLTGATLLGQNRIYLINQRLGQFLSTASRAIFNTFLNQVLAGVSREHCEIVLAPEDMPPRDLYLEGVGLADDDYRWCHIVAMDITDRKRTEKALRASETFNTTILNSLSESVVVLDAEGVILKVNTAWERFAEDNGAPELARRSVGLSYRNVCLSAAGQPGGEMALAAWNGIEAVLKEVKSYFAMEYPCDSPQVSRWFRMYVCPLTNQHQGVVILHENITERRQNEEWLRLSEARYSAIVEGQTDLVCRFLPDGTLTFCNNAYCHYFGHSREEILATNFIDLVPEDDREFVKAQAGLCNANHATHTCEHRVLRADGEERWIQWTDHAILDENGALIEIQSVGRDVTDGKRAEAALRELAITDDLTGLANRRHFMTRLNEEYARLQRNDAKRAAVLMLDLDHFKKINDRHGHAIGDAVLAHFAALIRHDLRRIDTAGRVGGEEFALILPGADPVAAQAFAERLRQKVAESPCLHQGQRIPFTVSIGIAALQITDPCADAALIRADQALYRAKQQGRNQVVNEKF